MMSEAFAAGMLPIQGTEIASQYDGLYNFLVWLSIVFFLGVVGAMIYFAVKYNRKNAPKPKYITGNHTLEAIFVVVPGILLMVIFGWGYSVYHNMSQAPSDAYEIRVIGKQWSWQFLYDNGKSSTAKLYVPMNRPVKLVMTSEDVIHSFYIPNFRIKQDVVPGMYTSLWFETSVPGRHQVFCAEYCGGAHSQMLAEVFALNDQQWQYWLQGKEDKIGEIPVAGQDQLTTTQAAPVAAASDVGGLHLNGMALNGKRVAETKGCIACHSNDGSTKIGPSWKGLYNKKVGLQDGTEVVADENYLRQSIEEPNARIVKGFSPTMPTFKGLVSEKEMVELLAYIKALK